MTTAPQTLVLGIGNILWADEGFGVRAVEHLHAHYALPESARVVDGGTQGLNLLPLVEEADILVIFDAVDFGCEPGTLVTVEDGEVPAFLSARKMSLHQTGFQEVLALAALRGRAPEEVLLCGVQPLVLEDYGGSLSEPVRAAIKPAVSAALDWLARLGVRAALRPAPPTDAAADLMPEGIALAEYEAGRPAPGEAPRLGDPRVLAREDIRFEPKRLLDEEAKVEVHLDGTRPGGRQR